MTKQSGIIAVLALSFLAAAPAHAGGPQCLENYGAVACGYDCIANYGQVKCARTPAGACLANYGKVVCWDPYVSRRARWVPKAECIANYGDIACGYGCVANYGEVRCAQRPGGYCIARSGRVTCTD